MSISDILVTFYKHEQSLIISNDGTQEGPGYESSYEYYSYDYKSYYYSYDSYSYDYNYYDEKVVIGAFHHIQYGFFPFIWKNSLFMVTGDGNIYRLKYKGKL